MDWTDDEPTVPGYYFLRSGAIPDIDTPYIAELRVGYGGIIWWVVCGNEDDISPLSSNTEFLGPITPEIVLGCRQVPGPAHGGERT